MSAGLRQQLAEVRDLRARAEEMRIDARAEMRRVLEEAQRSEEMTFAEAASLLGLTRDGAYKALRKEGQ